VNDARNATVLAGIDGSTAADAAARWAADEAALRSVNLELLLGIQIPVVGHPEYEYPPEFAVGIRTAGRATLDRVADDAVARHPDLQVVKTLKEGDARLVLDEASKNAGLAVVGSRGKGRLAEVLLGSVALHLAAHAHSPVAVVPESDHHTMAGPIVVGADGSDNSDAALGFAFDEAAMRGAELVAILGWDELSHQRFARRPVIDGTAGEEGETLLSQQLSGWCEKYPGVPVSKVVHGGSPAEALLGRGSQPPREPQLIVVGSRGRGGLSGLILGSTSHTVIIHSHCPVVVVRQGRAR
jgi:nucleotide-binding universal stress UspA family protein